MRLAQLSVALLAVASACGGASSAAPTQTTGSASTGATTLPACPLFDPADASFMGCGAARAYVSCSAPNGGGMSCLSDDPAQCPGGGAMVSPGCSSSAGCASGYTCSDGCKPNEFGVSCGAIGPASGTAPGVPAACRTIALTPAGVVFACCPCGP